MSVGPFLDGLRRGPAVLGDGAWGTVLILRGLPTGDAPERVCLERPELLSEIAVLYLEAGAEVVTTNTFGANPERLALHGVGGRLEEICSGAVAAVRADLLCVETMTDLAEAEVAVRAAREAAPCLPVVATMSFEASRRGLFTVMGDAPKDAAPRLAAAGADVVGANCRDGSTMAGIAHELRANGAAFVAVRPNAGLPALVRGTLSWPETPEVMAARLPEILDAGVALVGGCCGTTPDHVRALRAALAT